MSDKERVNILLVDDQPAKLLSYEAILGQLGENLVKAGSGREALEHLLRTDIGVVLVDVCMPDLDGFELAEMIHQHPRHTETSIIFVSAVHMTDFDRLRGYECGAVDYVSVPIVPEILRAKVGIFADLYRKTRQLERLNAELELRVAERTAELEASAERLRQSEEALKATDRRKDEFLAMLAHELRNPLAPIRNAVEIQRLRGPVDPELQWGYDVISRQVDHLTRLVGDLLDVSRITRGKLEVRRERIDLLTTIRGAAESIQPLVLENGHTLNAELPPRPVHIVGDVVRLSQVFLNLLDNATKYTPRGGMIRLLVELDGNEAIVRVRDTGAGIASEDFPYLFQMFYQTRYSRASSQGGLGIGLTLVRRLVEMHGGTVEVFSAGADLGSEFVVRLPILRSIPEPEVPSAPEAEARAPAPPRKILVADDNRDSAESLARLLRLGGNEVAATVHDGRAAVDAAEETRPEVILLDIGMPLLNGYDAARLIRERPWGKDVLIIALTGWGQEEDRRRAREAGFDGHLVKPVDHHALERLLARSALPESASGV